MNDLQERLEKLNVNGEKLKKVEGDIGHLINSFNNVINSVANDIKDDIINTKLGERLGKDMSEEDADKMLIIYGEATTADLDNLSLAKKRSKVVKLIEELGKEDCQEYNLAVHTRISSLKNKLIKTIKAEVIEQIGEAVENKIQENEQIIERDRTDLAKTEEYQKEQEAIEDAQAKKIVRDVIKKRASRRKSAYSAVARAAVSAVADQCVEQTRENIIAQYDNAVTVAKQTQTALEEQGKNPVENQEHYQEMEEITLESLENKQYQLPEVKAGTDKVKNKGEKSQLGELEMISAAEAVHSTNGTVPQTVGSGID